MKKIFCTLFLLMASILLTGAAYDAAPVLPTKDYYVNDYSGALFREHMSELSQIAHQTYEDTGVQFVLLVTDHLSSMEPEEYAYAILSGWDVQAPSGHGMLLLIDRGSGECYLFAGDPLSAIISDEDFETIRAEIIAPYFEKSNYSTGISNAYKAVARQLYQKNRLELPPNLELEESSPNRISTGALVFIAVAFLALGRSMYVSHKYRKKYLYRHEYKRRSFSSKQFKDDDINPSHLKTNPHQEPGADSNIRKSGFIIYRDNDDGGDGDSHSKTE